MKAVICPNCGEKNIYLVYAEEHAEKVEGYFDEPPTEFWVQTGHSLEDYPSSIEAREFFCEDCQHTWDVPSPIELHWS